MNIVNVLKYVYDNIIFLRYHVNEGGGKKIRKIDNTLHVLYAFII